MTTLPLPQGFRAAGIHAGIKKAGRGLDLGLLIAERAAPVAALFTRNELLGAHVIVCREQLARSGGLVRAILANSGCANCATGERGLDDARRSAGALAELIGCPPEQVLPVSTGAIGAHLPIERIVAALPDLLAAASPDAGIDFARAIMTTDSHPKGETADLGALRVTGIAKGAGMIHPDLATMLAFLLTDAPTGEGRLLQRVAERSFHRMSIDGDTSPNDTLLLWSTADSSPPIPAEVEAAVTDVATRLCRQIAADGEGASRLITIEVRGAASDGDAAEVGRVIATSPLTKTAVAGRDPNWGRILSAAGRAGLPIDAARARVWVGETTLYENGQPFPEAEPAAAAHLRDQREVVLGVDLGVGTGEADVWTCDLTADYVRINADYRS